MENLISWLSANISALEIFSLATGIIYMVMQIFQNRWMWYLDILTAGSAMIVAILTNVWAQAAMNLYFLVMAVLGIFNWRKLEDKTEDGKIHIVKLSKQSTLRSAVFLLIGSPILCALLVLTNDPAPVADGMSFALSIIAALFLMRSHLEQWMMWIAADMLAIVIYADLGAWWMVALYYSYIVSSCFGLVHWRRHGQFFNE